MFLSAIAGPPVFYLAFRFLGPKPAIAILLAMVLVQISMHRPRGSDASRLFWLSCGITLLFGALDLLITTPKFLRLEPGIRSVMIGLAFGSTLALRRPLAAWVFVSLPSFLAPPPGELSLNYMRGLTLVWAAYFLLRAAAYFYMAFSLSLGDFFLLRPMVGGASIGLLVLGEIAFRRFRGRLGERR